MREREREMDLSWEITAQTHEPVKSKRERVKENGRERECVRERESVREKETDRGRGRIVNRVNYFAPCCPCCPCMCNAEPSSWKGRSV